MPSINKSQDPIHRRFAARRLASGQSPVQVAALFNVPASAIAALMQDRDFREIVGSFRAAAERPEAEQMAERQAMVMDALDCLVEDRNAGSVHWLASKIGTFDRRPSGGNHELDHLRWDSFENIYEMLPERLQKAYREYDPDFEPGQHHEEDDAAGNQTDPHATGNLIPFPQNSTSSSAKAADHGRPMHAEVVYDDILDVADEPEDEVTEEEARRVDDEFGKSADRRRQKASRRDGEPIKPEERR